MIGTVSPAVSDAKSLIASDVRQGEDIVGQIVNAVSLEDATYVLFEIQLSALESVELAGLQLANQEQSNITLLDLAYGLDKPE